MRKTISKAVRVRYPRVVQKEKIRHPVKAEKIGLKRDAKKTSVPIPPRGFAIRIRGRKNSDCPGS